MTTSFSGADKLVTIIESGNASNTNLDLDLQSKKGDSLKISNLYYELPLSKDMELIFGPKMFGYVGLAANLQFTMKELLSLMVQILQLHQELDLA